MIIHIVNIPAGEAPENVRAAWVGVLLPVAGPQRLVMLATKGVLSGPRTYFGEIVGILLGRTKIQRGYRVKSAIAIDRLSRRSPDAANWWRENAPHFLRPSGVFVFLEDACVVEDPDPAAG